MRCPDSASAIPSNSKPNSGDPIQESGRRGQICLLLPSLAPLLPLLPLHLPNLSLEPEETAVFLFVCLFIFFADSRLRNHT